MADKMQKEHRRKGDEAKRWEGKFRDMQATIQRNESIIHMLRQQLMDYQQREVRMSEEVC